VTIDPTLESRVERRAEAATGRQVGPTDVVLRRRTLATIVALVAALIVPVVLFGLSVRDDTTGIGFDESALKWTQRHRITEGFLHFVMLESTGISFGGSALVISALIAWMLKRSGRPRAAWALCLAPFIAGLLIEVILKPWFHRSINGSNAYASGSTASGAVVALAIAYAITTFTGRRSLGIAAFVVMLLSVLPRMYFYVLNKQHYLSDELAGVAVGVSSTLLAFLAVGVFRGSKGKAAIISSAGSDT
jgi:hypothetical protein